jgi:hypothetical protein
VEVARALDPLYRNYLRRLDEMAARVGDGVLREPLARDGSGRAVAADSGLPQRFDVASSRTGETFEVHGARPDEPSARELTFDEIAVGIAPGNWEELPVSCTFAGADVSDDDLAALAGVLHSWAALAAAGGFARRNGAAWSGRLHGMSVSMRGSRLIALCDLGTCPPEGFESLLAALSAFGRERRPVARVDLGGELDS